MKTTMMRFAVTAAVGLAAFAGSAYAQSRPQAPATLPGVAVLGNSIRVSYADLDTRTAAGKESLAARVNHAAIQVCRFDEGMLRESTLEFHCRYDARAGAWEQYARNEARKQYASNDGDQAQTGQVIELAMATALTR